MIKLTLIISIISTVIATIIPIAIVIIVTVSIVTIITVVTWVWGGQRVANSKASNGDDGQKADYLHHVCHVAQCVVCACVDGDSGWRVAYNSGSNHIHPHLYTHGQLLQGVFQNTRNANAPEQASSESAYNHNHFPRHHSRGWTK